MTAVRIELMEHAVSPTLLKFPHDEIIFEDYEDEMVLLNLPEGVYYTLDRAGADCLLTLLGAATLDAALEALGRRYTSPAGEIAAGVGELVATLGRERLVLPRADHEPGIALDANHGVSGVPFSAPRVEQYRDIEDILKFDPVHEVTESGWPSIREDKSGDA